MHAANIPKPNPGQECRFVSSVDLVVAHLRHALDVCSSDHC